MTVIAGLIHNDVVWIGGDSAGTNSNQLTTMKHPKVFMVSEFIIGYTTSFRMGQILQYADFSKLEINDDVDKHEFMVSKFVPFIRRLFKRHGFLKTENGVDEGGTFLVGFGPRLFKIYEDFQVAEAIHPFDACGSGEDLALGSLFSTINMKLEPQEKLTLALEAAESFSAHVRRPFHILSRKFLTENKIKSKRLLKDSSTKYR